jgi:hypothetical protein
MVSKNALCLQSSLPTLFARRYQSPALPLPRAQKDSPTEVLSFPRTLALQESDHRRHRVLRRYLDTDIHVVRHQVSFYDPTFLLRQGVKNLAQLPAYRTIDGLPPLELWWISLAEHNVGCVNASCRIAGIDHQA